MGLRDHFEGAEELFGVERVSATGEAYRKVGLGDDPDDRAIVVDDGDPSHAMGSHPVLDVLDVVVGVATDDAAAHHVADPHVLGATLGGENANGEIAVGQDPDDPARCRVGHGERAAIASRHEFGGEGDGIVGSAAARVRRHDLVDFEGGDPIAVRLGQGGMNSWDATSSPKLRRAWGARLQAVRCGE